MDNPTPSLNENPWRDPERQHPAHHAPIPHHNQSILIFLTVCAEKRKPIFANPEAMKAVIAAWCEAEAWMVGRYVFMPDHIHLFCAPHDPTVPVTKWVKYWKSMASRHWPRPVEQPIWQPDCWDTQLRRGESYTAKWHYVRMNPVRKGLVKTPDDWAYGGEMNVLEWHE
ncbi:MAG: transposase [Verrucomicrobiota bacterium]